MTSSICENDLIQINIYLFSNFSTHLLPDMMALLSIQKITNFPKRGIFHVL